MQVVQQKLPKNTFKLAITLDLEEITKSQEKVWAKIVNDAELDGFRKGKAPAVLVKSKVDPHKAEKEILIDLISTYYPKAIEDQNLHPVTDPKVEATELDLTKNYTFSVTIAERPTLTIGDYKKAIKEAYRKKNEVTSPPKADHNNNLDEPKPALEHTHLSPNEIIEAVTSVTIAEVSDLLIEEEVDKMLSRLVNQLQAVKLDMDAYLKSQNKTGDSLRAEYAQLAQKNIIGELAMMEVVSKEGVEATDAEVDQTLAAMGDPKLQEQYSKDNYQKAYIKAIIAKNKVIWQLSSPEEDKDAKN